MYTKEYKNTVMKMNKEIMSTCEELNLPTIEYGLTPYVLDRKMYEYLDEVSATITRLLKKTVDLYIRNESVRSMFDFSQELNDLIVSDNMIDSDFPVARYDLFLNKDLSFKMCEVNTDGSAGMFKNHLLNSMYYKHFEVFKSNDIQYFDLFELLIDEFILLTRHKSIKTIAIVDDIKSVKAYDIYEFESRFKNRGYDAYIVDASDLDYKNELSYKGIKIDAVYRRLVTSDFIKNINDYPAFAKACTDNKTVIFGPIRSQIVHSKMLFKVFHNPNFQRLLDEKEVDFILQTIPYTEELELAIDVFGLDDVVLKKDNYVLKPKEGYASNGVFIGNRVSQNEWEDLVKQCQNSNYLIQEYVCPPLQTISFIKGDEIIEKKFYSIVGLYQYNHKFSGCYHCISETVDIGGMMLPTFYMLD